MNLQKHYSTSLTTNTKCTAKSEPLSEYRSINMSGVYGLNFTIHMLNVRNGT